MTPPPGNEHLDGLRLEASRRAPLHQQISDGIRRRITSGALRVDARLPSSRDLASQLGVSRATVELAYSNLAAEGYVARRSAAGTRVLPLRTEAPRPRAQAPAPLMPGLASEAARQPRLFQMGLPALDAFPRKQWSRLAARHARSLSLSRMVYQDPSGFAPLRRAIANQLAINRGLAFSEKQVFVTSGFLGALSLAARSLFGTGDKVLVEDPGFPPARDAITLAGGMPVAVPVDGSGMDVAAGIACAPDARAALISPVAQFPLGASLSASRRAQLLDWARQSQAWVLQDDYEENLSGADRAPALGARAESTDRVLYLGSFSNVLFPGFRQGYLVAPESLVPKLEHAAALLPGHQSLLDQMVVCDFITQGHFARHLARMRSLYAERGQALAQALGEVFGGLGRVESCGMHLLLRLPAGFDDVALAATARAHGLAVNALSPMSVRAHTGPGLLLGYTNILPEAAMEAALRLRSALQAHLPSRAEHA